jgi:hypothetical protein
MKPPEIETQAAMEMDCDSTILREQKTSKLDADKKWQNHRVNPSSKDKPCKSCLKAWIT